MKNSIIYLIDDDFAIRDSLTVLIESVGFNVHCFESAETFFQGYSPVQPACLILDIRMPTMNGLELQAELSKLHISIPIIFISGDVTISDLSKAYRAGALDFILKPIDTQLLVERIHEALSKDIAARKIQGEKHEVQASFDCLTPREKEILQLIVCNHSSKEAARILGISYRTVELHRARIMEKMHTKNTADLVAKSISNTLFSKLEFTKEKSYSLLPGK